MLRVQRNRPTSFYYLAFRMTMEARSERRETRGIRQRYLIRKTVDPMDIPDTEFKKRYRLSKQAVRFLAEELRSKTNLRASKRVSLEHKFLCALSFYATGSYQRLVGMGKHLGQPTVSNYVREVTEALNNPRITSTHIKFPTLRGERDLIKQKFFQKYGIPGVCGCIDGSHFRIFTPNKEIEHLYYCRKHYHSLNVQIICDSDCRILNVNPKYGGATHDAFIWDNSFVNQFMKELHQNNEHVWLLGDSGYPQRPWLMTPITDAVEGSPEANYTSVHGKARVVVENTFGRLKNRWRCVNKDRTLHYNPVKCAKIISACCVLHNIALRYSLPDPEGFVPVEVAEEHFPFEDQALNEGGARDDLIRGRAIRNILVQRINRL